MRRRLATFALVAAFAVACARSEPATSSVAPDAASTTAPPDGGLLALLHVVDASPSDPPDAARPRAWPELTPFERAAPRRGKSIGHTSVVFKVELDSGATAAFKPESRRGRTRYRGEIAAHRLAVALGLHNVPPAIPRSFEAAALRASMAPTDKARALFDEEAIVTHGSVRGALIPWIEGLSLLPLESEPLRGRWSRWLSAGSETPPDQASLAAQISTMVLFDTVTGNWDRWSGGNVGFDKGSNTLLFIDNDGAFFDPVPTAPLAAQLGMLARIDRYSKRFVAALRAMGPLQLADAVGDERQGVPLLSPRVVAAADERRRRVLAIVDEKIATQGAERVLCFE